MNLTRLDYCLLDLVVELRSPMAFVVEPVIGPMFNVEGHDAPDTEVAAALSRLLDNGLIEAQRYSDDLQDEIPIERMSPEAVLAAFPEKCWGKRIAYGLTDAGASAWEHAAMPDWSRYVEESSDPEDKSYVLQAATEKVADEYLSYLCRYQIDLLSKVEQTRLHPWQATYWKSLPDGVRLTFRAWDKPDRISGPTCESEFVHPDPWWYTRPW